MKSKEVTRFPTDKLLKSQALAGYQEDFAKAILTKKEYTVEEAKAAIDKALKPKKGDK